MKLDNVDLYSNDRRAAKFSFKDPKASNPYLVQAIDGLDADEIVSKFYGQATNTKTNYYNLSQQKRDIVVKVALSPQFSQNKTYSDLRDDLYRAISSSRSGTIELRFNYGETSVASVWGRVKKVEAPHFDRTATVQITIECFDSMLKSPTRYEVDMATFVQPYYISDTISTAPHGFVAKILITGDNAALTFREVEINPEWLFRIEPGSIAGVVGFKQGDVLHLSSETSNRYVYIVRGGVTVHLTDKIQPGSVWPILFPGDNEFHIANQSIQWKSISYYHTYWGV